MRFNFATMYLKERLNPIPTRLCHVIYCWGDKNHPCLVGIGLKVLRLLSKVAKSHNIFSTWNKVNICQLILHFNMGSFFWRYVGQNWDLAIFIWLPLEVWQYFPLNPVRHLQTTCHGLVVFTLQVPPFKQGDSWQTMN